MKSKRINKKTLLIELLISLILSVAAIFYAPQTMNRLITREKLPSTSVVVTLVACVCILVLYIALFYFKSRQYGAASISKSAGRFFAVCAFFIIIILLLSLFSGMISVAAYSLLKNTMSLDQIKGIINYSATILAIVVFPVIDSVFWAESIAENDIFRDFINGIRMGGKKYLKLLILFVVAFVMGLLVRITSNNMTESFGSHLIVCALLALIGTARFAASEAVCSKTDRKENK